MHIDDLGIREWLQQRMEPTGNHVALTLARQLRILTKLTGATIFEDFIQKKFVGAKSFSLEGCETLIPLLDLLIERASVQNVNDIVIGMAHRGRLNVLANVVGKNAQEIFREFADLDHLHYEGRGDVKYHLGYRGQWTSSQGETLRLSLCFNPSHLEYVDPVAVGRLRARQDRKDDVRRRRGLCILLHGDAAFAGEGVVQETLNMSQLSGYSVGGTIHIIINNQIGFTTTHWQARSAIYASGVAKMLQVPILHVNGEDPEAAAQVVRLAVDFRNEYQRDVVIDMYGYRRRGHNETDEPRFTQPLQYQAIQHRKPVRDAYLERLLSQGGVTGEQAERIASERRERLERELASAKSDDYIHIGDQVTGDWSGYNRGADAEVPEVDTGVAATRLRTILQKLGKTPKEIVPDRRIDRLLPAARRHGGRHTAGRLGLRRSAGVRQPAARRVSRASDGTGLRARHVRAPARRRARLRDGLPVRAAPAPVSAAGRRRDSQQPALGDRPARLRIRIQPGVPGRPHHLGGAVRRLRQCRAGDRRPVHFQR